MLGTVGVLGFVGNTTHSKSGSDSLQKNPWKFVFVLNAGGAKVGLQLFVWKIMQQTSNNKNKLCCLHSELEARFAHPVLGSVKLVTFEQVLCRLHLLLRQSTRAFVTRSSWNVVECFGGNVPFWTGSLLWCAGCPDRGGRRCWRVGELDLPTVLGKFVL